MLVDEQPFVSVNGPSLPGQPPADKNQLRQQAIAPGTQEAHFAMMRQQMAMPGALPQGQFQQDGSHMPLPHQEFDYQ